MFNKEKFLELLKVLFIGILVAIATFPINNWIYTRGIDPSLMWVFNMFFDKDLNLAQNIIFPHGPLAFFMYPTIDNIYISVFVESLLKVLLVFSIYKLPSLKGEYKLLIAFAFAFFISIISSFMHLLLANIILLLVNYYYNEKLYFKIFAFFLTAFAFYIRSYVAIISLILAFSFIFYYLILTKKYKKTIIDFAILFALIILFRLFIFGSLSGFFTYLYGVINLAQDNSSATSYYPYNNWVLLSIFLISIISIFLINRTKQNYFYVSLIALSLFAAWKHGMAREDLTHVKSFLFYVIIVILIFLLSDKKRIFYRLSLSLIAIFMLSINMKSSVRYHPPEFELFRAVNLYDFFFDFSKIEEYTIKRTEYKIRKSKISDEMLDAIKNDKVDVYPWEYSVIPANKLNWQPRIVLHSYASYTSWLDEQNANHFNSKNAPKFIIWEKKKITNDINNGDFNSINNRYLLNDEPKTIINIIKNYTPKLSDDKFLLLEKRKEPLVVNNQIIKTENSSWNKWINVPDEQNSLLRTKLFFSKTLKQRLKSFLYKDEQFWIYLKLQNGIIHKYRIIPKNAEDGIWITPYYYDIKHKYNVKQIMFMCSNKSIISDDLSLEWETISFNKPNIINSYFNNGKSIKDSIIIESNNTFDNNNNNIGFWNNIIDKNIVKNGNDNNKSYILNKAEYSATFQYRLDSIKSKNIRIVAECWVKADNIDNDIILVISIDNENGNIIWEGVEINKQMINKNEWFNAFNTVKYYNDKPNCTLKAYLWNKDNNKIIIDDFKVLIIAD